MRFVALSKSSDIGDWLYTFLELLVWQLHDAKKSASASNTSPFLGWLLSVLRLDTSLVYMDDAVRSDGNTKIHQMAMGASGIVMAKTRRGNYGLLPQQTRIGDLVVVFPGCSIPFVLRREGQEYLFVGTCHLALPFVIPADRPNSREDCESCCPSANRTFTYGLQSLDGKTEHHLRWLEPKATVTRIV